MAYRKRQKFIEQKSRLFWGMVFLLTLLFSGSCVTSPEEYDSTLDNGTYTGSMTVYDGAGTDPDFIDRTCPVVSGSLVVDGENVTLTTNDTYPNYGHAPGVITNHVASGTAFSNNKFNLEVGWAIEETDTQLEDLMNLKICEATPPSTPGDTSTGGRGLLQDFAFKVGEPGFVGEYGFGTARGSLWYGVRCTDGTFLPICLYFMQLDRN
ncbi:MAG: hypothetical protein NXH75_14195 [Halobacteriovoraceae bacterium]|nr:hypothetical protein [Halobacteriovoraceae bacterium]